jgi:hypothetical protein
MLNILQDCWKIIENPVKKNKDFSVAILSRCDIVLIYFGVPHPSAEGNKTAHIP